MANPLRWRGHEVSRLEGFSDTVFAFALTLLVVSLEVPQTVHELMDVMRGFLPFACSFTLLIWIWHQHNLFFRRFGMQDGLTVALNAAILFVVLFYVYPLKFMFNTMFGGFGLLRIADPELTSRSIRAVFVIYGVGFVVLFLLFAALYRHALRHQTSLQLTALEVFDAKAAIREHLVNVCVGLCSIIAAVLLPPRQVGFAGFLYMALGPAQGLHGWRSGRRRRALEQSQETAAAAQ